MSAEKKELRAAMKALLAAVGPTERRERSARAAERLRALSAYREASLVLAFLSMPTEIDTLPVIEASLADGKRVAVPRIDGGDIAFVELAGGWRDWPRDPWGIPAPPDDAPALRPEAVAAGPSLSLVPGLAFDRSGGRLGRGKGYYDRWLAASASPRHATVGFGYETQVVDKVPMDPHDVPLDALALG